MCIKGRKVDQRKRENERRFAKYKLAGRRAKVQEPTFLRPQKKGKTIKKREEGGKMREPQKPSIPPMKALCPEGGRKKGKE